MTPHFFLTQIKDNTHTSIIYQFFKISRVRFFLNRNSVRKVTFFPIYFIQKRLYWTHILRLPPFHNNHGEVWLSFSHIYTRNTINITYAKIKDNSRSRFFKPQPARASPLDPKIFDIQRIFLNALNVCGY